MLVNVGEPLEGLKENDKPLGEEEAERLTVVAEPLTSVTVMVEILLAPRHIERLLGLADIEKSKAALTVNAYVVVFDKPPPEAVTVMEYVPVGVEVEVDMVMVEVAVGELGLIVTLAGLKLAEAPEGSPEAEKLTVMDEL